MRTNEEKRGYKDMTIKERAVIAKKRLLDPESTNLEFCRKHNIETKALSIIEKKINFDESSAVGELMSRVLSKDNELIDLATDLNLNYVKQIGWKKILKDKEIEVADKLVNTAMKRAAVIASMREKEDWGDWIDVVINF